MEKDNCAESNNRREFWKNHHEIWETSDLSAAEYCRQNELKYQAFLWWKKKLKPQTEHRDFVELPFPSLRTNSESRLFELTVEPDFQFSLKINFNQRILKRIIEVFEQNVSGDA